jgi:hypothetical protein
MYAEDPESVDLRSGQNKKKYGHNITVKRNFPVCISHIWYELNNNACSLYILIDYVLYRAVRRTTRRDTTMRILLLQVPQRVQEYIISYRVLVNSQSGGKRDESTSSA